MTPRDDGSQCAAPLDAAVLMDYWLAVLRATDEETVELHLLECDHCGHRLREMMALAESLRALARSGTLQVIVDDGLLARAAAAGKRVRAYTPPAGTSVPCTVSIDDDMMVARLTADLTTAARVDLSWSDMAGVERQRLTDIPVRADTGVVVCQQSIAWVKASPTSSMVARLIAVGHGGDEQVLGEYTFHHTRTIPGPPGW